MIEMGPIVFLGMWLGTLMISRPTLSCSHWGGICLHRMPCGQSADLFVTSFLDVISSRMKNSRD